MEADWSVEIGPDLPEICVPWEGFVDLRQARTAFNTIPEAARYPAIARALQSLNSNDSLLSTTFFTVKTDVWLMNAAEIDPYEFGALPEQAQSGIASYIDLLERDKANFSSFAFHEERAKRTVNTLRAQHGPPGRIDLVIRPARKTEEEEHDGYGITLYAAGCGADAAAAAANWEIVLEAAVLATIKPAGNTSPPATTRASSSIG